MMEMDNNKKKVCIYEGLYRELKGWLEFVFSAMKRCMLCALDISPQSVPDKETL